MNSISSIIGFVIAAAFVVRVTHTLVIPVFSLIDTLLSLNANLKNTGKRKKYLKAVCIALCVYVRMYMCVTLQVENEH